MYEIPENCEDEIVLISPGYLVEHRGLKKKTAVIVAERAFRICSARWPNALPRISNGENIDDFNATFISIGYSSKISNDVDMEVWAENGAHLRSEIHDYILVRACEESGVPVPLLTKQDLVASVENYVQLLGKSKIPRAYDLIAAESARQAALLAGIESFDASGIPFTQKQSRQFRSALEKAIEKIVSQALRRRLIPERAITSLLLEGMKIGANSVAGRQGQVPAIAIAVTAGQAAHEAFAKAYFELLRRHIEL